MSDRELLDVLTRGLVIAMYTVSFFLGIFAVRCSNLWARRRSGIVVMVVSGAWLVFYILIVPSSLVSPLASTALWSRVMGYITSAALISLSLNIIYATKMDSPIYLVLDGIETEVIQDD